MTFDLKITYGCSYVDGLEWKGCYYWNESNLDQLRKLNLAEKCGKSMLKDRQLFVLFINDFQHLPWLILLSDSLFRLKLMSARKWSAIPPGKVNFMRQFRFHEQPVIYLKKI